MKARAEIAAFFLGLVTFIFGIDLIYPPAAFIACGLLLMCIAAFSRKVKGV